MLVNSVGNAKSVGSIVQSKKNNTTNICMFTGSSTLNIDPYQTFIWCFFLFVRKERWTIAVNWEHHFHFLYWMTHLRYTTGIPFSHDHGMTCVKDISQIQDHFRDGIDGMCQTTKKIPGGFHPASPSRKYIRVNIGTSWRFPRSWGYHGGIQITISDWGTPMTMETSIHLEPLQPERCRWHKRLGTEQPIEEDIEDGRQVDLMDGGDWTPSCHVNGKIVC